MVTCENCKEEVPETIFCLKCGYPLYVNAHAKEEGFGGAPLEPIEQEGNASNLVHEPIPTTVVLDEVVTGPTHIELTDFGSPGSVESNLQALHERIEDGDLEWITLIRESRALYGARGGGVEVEWIRLIRRERELRRRLTSIGVVNG
ncbi:MAG: hypothetical protein OEW93_00030 [Candidatus Bathyarchaeota archaeon]|nr:hypothetical protein [Candidatus Bathyarchaeota archaeon]MDH5790881.1 hypothetical protein [Candidatus Bathyarchaeota archaeon]